MAGQVKGIPDEKRAVSRVEMRDVADGLWIWRFENPFWKTCFDWEPLTASTCVDSRSETLVVGYANRCRLSEKVNRLVI
jgi:hypothetical protein